MTLVTPTHRPRRARLGAVLAGTLLLILAAQPALAVTWGGETRLSDREAHRPRLLRTGPSSAISIWQRGSYVFARRTTDGGRTWTTRITLASGIGLYPSASASGSRVDLAYVKRVTAPDGNPAWRLFYRRSLDGGRTWQAPRPVTSAASKIADQDVARHANGQVSVAWTGLTTGNIWIRTSIDGGATFGPARLVGRTTNFEAGPMTVYRSDPRIAIGAGVTYVAYTSAPDTLVVRRSLNRGASWAAPVRFSTAAASEYSIVAVGSRAVVGYTTNAPSMRAVFRRTFDRGATWSSARPVVGLGSGQFSVAPEFAVQGGVLAVVYKAGKPGASPVWQRQSVDFGSTWSDPTRVSLVHVTQPDPVPAGLAILDGRQLAGYAENGGTDEAGLWVRRTR